jgi:hypothetical protein
MSDLETSEIARPLSPSLLVVQIKRLIPGLEAPLDPEAVAAANRRRRALMPRSSRYSSSVSVLRVRPYELIMMIGSLLQSE